MDESPGPPTRKKNGVSIGELVAVAGLAISALALWNSWNSDDKPASTTVVEKPETIPLVLRGHVEDGGRAIRIAPVEQGHALDSLTLTAVTPAARRASYGSEPVISAAEVESWLPKDVRRVGTGAITVEAVARYVERGETRTARQRYRIGYNWKDGGLFGGKSLRLTGLSRA